MTTTRTHQLPKRKRYDDSSDDDFPSQPMNDHVAKPGVRSSDNSEQSKTKSPSPVDSTSHRDHKIISSSEVGFTSPPPRQIKKHGQLEQAKEKLQKEKRPELPSLEKFCHRLNGPVAIAMARLKKNREELAAKKRKLGP